MSWPVKVKTMNLHCNSIPLLRLFFKWGRGGGRRFRYRNIDSDTPAVLGFRKQMNCDVYLGLTISPDIFIHEATMENKLKVDMMFQLGTHMCIETKLST